MRIITFRRIKEFSATHADAEVALKDWYHKVREKNWNNFNELNPSCRVSV